MQSEQLINEKNELNEFQKTLDSWDLLTKSPEEQTAELAKAISLRTVGAHSKSPVIEIVTHEDLFALVSDALRAAELPADVGLDHPDREGLAASFKEYCKKITVRPSPAEALYRPDWSLLDPIDRFIQIRTLSDVERQHIDEWAQAGYLQYLQQIGGIMPSYPEIRSIYFLARYLEFTMLAAQAGYQKVQAATEDQVAIYQP